MIEINNLTTIPLDENFLKKVAEEVLEKELEISKYRNIDLYIALVGKGRIRELNKKYRGKNRVTDVLAFPEREIGLGEIIICIREVKKNARRFSSDFKTELSRVLIHGILHLLGYNHEESEKMAKKMMEKQEYYLAKVLKS